LRADALELEDAHRLPHTLDVERPEILEVEEPAREIRRRLREVRGSGRREVLHPRREADGVPDGGVLHVQIRTDAADHYLAGVQSDPDGEAQALLAAQLPCVQAERVAQVQGRVARAPGVVLVRDRCAEDRHDAVTGVLVDGPFESVDAFREDRVEAVEDPAPILGIDVLGEVHRALHVREHHRHLLALPVERALHLADLVGKMRRHGELDVRRDVRRRETLTAVVAEPGVAAVLPPARVTAHPAQDAPSAPPMTGCPAWETPSSSSNVTTSGCATPATWARWRRSRRGSSPRRR
jgi:hypothetical protein